MEDRLPRKLAAILYADVAGYSRLTGVDEDATHRTLGGYLDLIASTIQSNHGQVVHYAGDAVLAKFDAVINSVASAVAIQHELGERNRDLPETSRVEFRIGVNLGDVIEDRGDIYGDGVNVAARLENLAAPGGICVSESVRTALGKKLDLDYEDLGEQQVKNIEQPVRAYRVRVGEESIRPLPDNPLPVIRDKPSIAVLPFENLSSDAEQEFFTDGMAEDIITALSKFRELLVIARNTTFTFKGQAVDVAEIGKQLQVRYVVEGSVRRAGNRIRITAQLIDADSGSHRWAERYDRSLDDVFEVQDEVTAAIVAAIAPEINQAEIERARRMPPNNLDVWGLYQRGLSLIPSGAEADFDAAIALFDEARKADPSFTDAHAMAAYERARYLMFFASDSDQLMLKEAEGILQTALRQDRNNPNCLLAQGYLNLFLKEYKLAAASLREAVALNPNFALAYSQLGFVLNQAGHAQEGLEALDVADRLNPRDPQLSGRLTTRAVSNFMLERYAECAECARRASRSENPRYWVDAILVAALHRLGHRAELEAAKKTLFERRPGFSISDVAHFFRAELIEALTDAELPQK